MKTKEILDDYKHCANTINEMRLELLKTKPNIKILGCLLVVLTQHFDKMFIDFNFNIEELKRL